MKDARWSDASTDSQNRVGVTLAIVLGDRSSIDLMFIRSEMPDIRDGFWSDFSESAGLENINLTRSSTLSVSCSLKASTTITSP